MNLSAEREQQLARDMGLDKAPTPRYSDIPKPNQNIGGLITFRKSLMLVDQLRTAAFHKYLNDALFIDQTMDAAVWSAEQSFAVMCRTDVPPPVNERITRATGIRPTTDDRDYFQWLASCVLEQWTVLGAKKMAAPLIFAGGDRKWKRDVKLKAAGAVPFMGVISKYERGPTLGANYGVIVPSGEKIDDDHRAVLVVDELPDTTS